VVGDGFGPQPVDGQRAGEFEFATHRHGGFQRGLGRIGREGVAVFGRRRQVFVFAFGDATIGPTDDQLHLLRRQGLIVTEVAEAFDRAPGRHAARQDFFLDGDGPRTRFVVGHQRKRLAVGVVAGGAMFVDDARNLTRPGDGRRDDVVALRAMSEHTGAE